MILKVRLTCAFMVLGLLVAMPSFAAESLETMISKGDHEGLQGYYSQQAQEFKTKAENWEFAAEFYDKHPGDATGSTSAAQHIAHCRTIAESLRKAAHEARDLASQHYQLSRKGP